MISFSIFGQQSINNYKYVIVANKLDFFKKADQYQTSSLTKFLFNKYGYKSYLDIENLPEEIIENKCSSLSASINNSSNMFTTKVNLVLKDCNDKIIYEGPVAKSKEKDHKKAFHEAIRNIFKDPEIKNYSYKPKNSIAKTNVKIVSTPKELPKVKKEISTPKIITKSEPKIIAKNVLYAQATNNGFQLVDTNPKVVFKVLKTNQENLFIIEGKNGILYKKGSNWIAEYYENNVLIQKEYQVKF